MHKLLSPNIITNVVSFSNANNSFHTNSIFSSRKLNSSKYMQMVKIFKFHHGQYMQWFAMLKQVKHCIFKVIKVAITNMISDNGQKSFYVLLKLSVINLHIML